MENRDEFIGQQKEILVAEKERIEAKIKELKKFPDYGSDEEDNLQEISDYESNLSIDQQLEYLLEKINFALSAIKNGSYGKCKICQKEIEIDRLKIMPYADVCVVCKKNK